MDLTISLGNILSILGSVIAVLAAFWRVSMRLVKLETELKMKLSMVWADYCHRHGLPVEDFNE